MTWARLEHEFRFAAQITHDVTAGALPDEEAATMLADSLKTISRLAEEVAHNMEEQRG